LLIPRHDVPLIDADRINPEIYSLFSFSQPSKGFMSVLPDLDLTSVQGHQALLCSISPQVRYRGECAYAMAWSVKLVRWEL
jgi:hypothetical protein